MPHMYDALEFLRLRDQGLPLLDVRSPAEFAKGHIPHALNLPLFSNEERAAVGTAHARQGNAAAVHLGLQLAGPQLAGKLTLAEQGTEGRKEVLMHCWRGGMRSASMAWLLETGGFTVHLLRGGYKAYRAHVRTVLGRPAKVLVLGGMTGCGKTDILREMARLGSQVIDLEGLANHRGSTFGGVGQKEQPTNEHVENTLYDQWAGLDFSRPVWMEDESRRIGTVTLCEEFFAHIERGGLVLLELPQELRVRRLVRMYAGGGYDAALLYGLERIAPRLGSEVHHRCAVAITEGRYAEAVAMVLGYYDKCYSYQIARRVKNIRQRIALQSDEPTNTASLLTALEQTLY